MLGNDEEGGEENGGKVEWMFRVHKASKLMKRTLGLQLFSFLGNCSERRHATNLNITLVAAVFQGN